jgi:hemolysin activation/secretion protein
MGGADTVRGYLEGERSGDSGVRGTLELRTPQFNPGGVSSAWRLWGLAFLDMARITTQQVFQKEQQRLRSVGLGLRINSSRGITVEVDAARALTNGEVGFTRAGDMRMHSRLVWGF